MAGPDEPVRSGPLTVVLSCPHCGGPTPTADDAVSSTCSHCGSFLVVAHPGREELFIATAPVDGAEDARAVVLAYRVQAYRADLVAEYGTPRDDGGRIAP